MTRATFGSQLGLPILAALILVAPLIGAAGSALASGSCQDVDETFTGTLTGVPDETVAGTSVESDTHTLEVGSLDCRVLTLEATLTSVGIGDTPTGPSDDDLEVAYEGITVAGSQGLGTDETVQLSSPPAGTYDFTVEPWLTVESPYELHVTATLEEDPPASGDNADDETVVIAVPDTGINPYHDEFSAETYPGDLNLSQDPATYIEGYPHGAERLDLSLDVPYEGAVDQDEWDTVFEETLYWIPGTKIVGAYNAGPVFAGETTILDDDGHGTKTASLAVGNTLGTCGRCLFVAVESPLGIKWALQQPWIDLVSSSVSSVGSAGVPNAGVGANPGNLLSDRGALGPISEHTRAAVERGQTVLFSAGNGFANSLLTPYTTYSSALAGPDWVVTVGAVADFGECECSSDEAPALTGGKPVDVASYALGNLPAASHDSTSNETQHRGVSAATPTVAGTMGRTMLEARQVLGDTVGGSWDSAIAKGSPTSGPHGGMLEDGQLTRAELEQATRLTAEHTRSGWASVVPPTLPTTFTPNDARWTQWTVEGWGVVSERSSINATDVVLGDQPLPDRPMDAAMATIDEQNRAALWGPPVAP